MHRVGSNRSPRVVIRHTLLQTKLVRISVLQPSEVFENPSTFLNIKQGQLFLYRLNGHGINLHVGTFSVKGHMRCQAMRYDKNLGLIGKNNENLKFTVTDW